jgi:hypothetical protein
MQKIFEKPVKFLKAGFAPFFFPLDNRLPPPYNDFGHKNRGAGGHPRLRSG